MSDATTGRGAAPDLDELIAADTGGRHPTNPMALGALVYGAFAWSLFQLWIASPLPFITGILITNDAENRAIHLGFAVFLTFLAYPALVRSPRNRVPLQDWALALVGAFCASYQFWFYDVLATRPGRPTDLDIMVSVAGLILLLEATRRSLGPPLAVVAILFLAYVFFGNASWLPDMIQYQGATVTRAMSHMWLGPEGVFGIALGVSTRFVFLFVLFGALLDKAGAGNYFIKLAFALLGHMRGGPAKAAVVSSGLTGVISGSSIANVVTTGTFTIPLMKRVGFTPEKAGAVEVAASVNGQIMPPVMGAAAFLMVEYVGIPYVEVMRHAVLPAAITYIALLYIVHLEALKAGMQGIARPYRRPWYMTLVNAGLVIAPLIILSFVIYHAIAWIKPAFGDAASWVIAIGVGLGYVGLLWYSTTVPELTLDDPNAPVTTLPEVGPTAKAGLYFLPPIVVLVWCLMVERFSPALSAFWATAFMIVILVTQRPLIAWFRRRGNYAAAVRQGWHELFDGMVVGARNMIGIGVATATAGIVVGTVTLTGVGLVMANFVAFLSGGNIIVMLLLVALLSLILGMGLPTTANYIVVSSLMAPVIVTVGAQNGLVVPLIAVHMFVFYFGIMADVTPPVGLASFAAAAISRGDPMRTGVTAFWYSLRTAVLPFLFIFNTELLLIDIGGPFHLVITVVAATIAMLVFAAATMGYFLTRSRIWESAVLLLVAFTLLRPGFWMDRLYPPTDTLPGTAIEEVVDGTPPGGTVRLQAHGVNLEGEEQALTVVLPLGPGDTAAERLSSAGLELREEEGGVFVDFVMFGSRAQQLGLDFDYQIDAVVVQNQVPDKQWMFIPALLVLAGIVAVQAGRRRRSAAPATARAG